MADLTITPSQILAGSNAVFLQGIAGETLTAGQVAYLDAGTNQYKLADANTTQALATVKGVVLHAATVGQPVRLQSGGDLTLGAGAAPAIGTIYILSATAGGIAPAADLASGMWTSVLGVGATGNVLAMNIHNSGQLKP